MIKFLFDPRLTLSITMLYKNTQKNKHITRLRENSQYNMQIQMAYNMINNI